MNSLILLPQPRHVALDPGSFRPAPGKHIALVGAPAPELLFAGERLRQALHSICNLEWAITATIADADQIGAVLRVDNRLASPQAYELAIDAAGIRISAGAPHGVFNAVSTLIQILQQTHGHLPALRISDAPDFADRGVLLDISRDKVPKMQTLFNLVDLLASWKINQLQLYTEHTFAYQNHRVVWQEASPLTGQDILELDRYCRERFVALVPNQNSFGHMHRWLNRAEYNHLAECPDARGEFWWGSGPFGLNPLDPRSLQFVCSLYDELLPHFSDPRLNVGCDETFDLGEGRSRDECDKRGVERVYLDFLLKIYREVKARGHTMMFWGDIVNQHPDLLADLPRDAIALEWGYEADYPFEETSQQFAAAGIPFYVCPGTSSWNSIAGRTDNAIANIRNAALAGLKHGAIGLLNTDWGDGGHWQYLPISYLGLAFGAAMSWCVESNTHIDLPCALDLFAFRDRAGVMGRIACDLGNVYRATGVDLPNSTLPFHLLTRPLSELREFFSIPSSDLGSPLEAIDRAVAPLARAEMPYSDGDLIKQEFESATQLLRHAARRGLLALEQDHSRVEQAKLELGTDLESILATYSKLWHARNRPGGFQDSIARLQRLRHDYR